MLRQTIALFLLVAGLAACHTGTLRPDMPDPAAKHCIDQGGTLRLVTAQDGSETAMCTLPNGVGCEEWAYFRGECPTPCPQQGGMKNCPMYAQPSPEYCVGGEVFVVKDSCGCLTQPQCDMTPEN